MPDSTFRVAFSIRVCSAFSAEDLSIFMIRMSKNSRLQPNRSQTATLCDEFLFAPKSESKVYMVNWEWVLRSHLVHAFNLCCSNTYMQYILCAFLVIFGHERRHLGTDSATQFDSKTSRQHFSVYTLACSPSIGRHAASFVLNQVIAVKTNWHTKVEQNAVAVCSM